MFNLLKVFDRRTLKRLQSKCTFQLGRSVGFYNHITHIHIEYKIQTKKETTFVVLVGLNIATMKVCSASIDKYP